MVEPAIGTTLALIQAATDGLGDDLMLVGGIAIGIAAGLLGLQKGWGVLRRFIK